MMNALINILLLYLRSTIQNQKFMLRFEANGVCRLCGMMMKRPIYKGYLSSNDLKAFTPTQNLQYIKISEIFKDQIAIDKINKRLSPQELADFADLYTRGLLYDRKRILYFNPIQLFLHDICLYKTQLYINENLPNSNSFIVFSTDPKDFEGKIFYDQKFDVKNSILKILTDYKYDYLNGFKIEYVYQEIDSSIQSNWFDIQQAWLSRIIQNIETFIKSKSAQISEAKFRRKVYSLISKEREALGLSKETIISKIEKLLKYLIEEPLAQEQFKNELSPIFSEKKDFENFYYFIYFIEKLFSIEDLTPCEEITFHYQDPVSIEIDDLVAKNLKNMNGREKLGGIRNHNAFQALQPVPHSNERSSNSQNFNAENSSDSLYFQNMPGLSEASEIYIDILIASEKDLISPHDFHEMHDLLPASETRDNSLISYLFDFEKKNRTLNFVFKRFLESHQSKFSPDFLNIFLSKFVFNEWEISEIIVIIEFLIRNKINYLHFRDFDSYFKAMCSFNNTNLVNFYLISIKEFGIIKISETILADIYTKKNKLPILDENFLTDAEIEDLDNSLNGMTIAKAQQLKRLVFHFKSLNSKKSVAEKLNELLKILTKFINKKKKTAHQILSKILKTCLNESNFDLLNDIKYIDSAEKLKRFSKKRQKPLMKIIKKYYDEIGRFPFGMFKLMAFDFENLFEFEDLTEEYFKDFVLSVCQDLPDSTVFDVNSFVKGIPYLINAKENSIINAENFIKFMNLLGLEKFHASITNYLQQLEINLGSSMIEIEEALAIFDIRFFISLLEGELNKRISKSALPEVEAPQDQINAANNQNQNVFEPIPIKKNLEKELKTYKRRSPASDEKSKTKKLRIEK